MRMSDPLLRLVVQATSRSHDRGPDHSGSWDSHRPACSRPPRRPASAGKSTRSSRLPCRRRPPRRSSSSSAQRTRCPSRRRLRGVVHQLSEPPRPRPCRTPKLHAVLVLAARLRFVHRVGLPDDGAGVRVERAHASAKRAALALRRSALSFFAHTGDWHVDAAIIDGQRSSRLGAHVIVHLAVPDLLSRLCIDGVCVRAAIRDIDGKAGRAIGALIWSDRGRSPDAGLCGTSSACSRSSHRAKRSPLSLPTNNRLPRIAGCERAELTPGNPNAHFNFKRGIIGAVMPPFQPTGTACWRRQRRPTHSSRW